MTLEEAIKHAEEVAKQNNEIYEAHCRIYGKEVVEQFKKPECKKCAEEHEQLAKWLKELNEVKKIVEHWNDEKSTFVAACDAFEEILKVFNLGVKT